MSSSLSRVTVRKFYDQVAGIYDWFSIFESKAKTEALECLELEPGFRLLNVGLGTGSENQEMARRISPNGSITGIDLSPRMLQVAATHSSSNLCQGDARDLPFTSMIFDRIYCAYVLDLVTDIEVSTWLAGFRRVLRPGGKVVLLSLVEGVNLSSKILVWVWKKMYAIDARICGGCRPIALSNLLKDSGFRCLERRIIVQLALPSEVIVAG